MKKFLTATAIAFAAVLVTATPALADHNANNRATFTGAASGTAIANYSEGQGTFNASISVRDLEPGSYTYTVTRSTATMAPVGDPQLICSFEVGASGNGGCQADGLRLRGFTTAEIRQGTTVIDSDSFTRQGKSECRDPGQLGTESAQCPNRTTP